MSFEVRLVESGPDLEAFINFPHVLYQGDPNYVPEIYIGQKNIFNKKTYPFFEYGQAKLFLAWHYNTIKGRIAVIHNPRYNSYHSCKVGFFGFFDCVNDQKIAEILLGKAVEEAGKCGFNQVIGPTNYTTNETAGTLVSGFESPPVVMMTYNYPYYNDLLVKAGFRKEMDLYAYFLDIDTVDKRSLGLHDKLEQRLLSRGIKIRQVTKKTLEEDARKIKAIYNQAWEKNWGFVPFTDSEFEYLKNDLVHILNPKFTFIAENNSEAIGFSISIPNVNEILIKNQRGRLFPLGLFRLWWGKNHTKLIRVLALGVVAEHRKQGIEALFFAKNIREALLQKIVGAEASWILENNVEMNLGLEKLNASRYKTYRLYKKNIE